MVDLSHNVSWEYHEGPSLGTYNAAKLGPRRARRTSQSSTDSSADNPTADFTALVEHSDVAGEGPLLAETLPRPVSLQSGHASWLKTARWWQRCVASIGHCLNAVLQRIASAVGDEWVVLTLLGIITALCGLCIDFCTRAFFAFRHEKLSDLSTLPSLVFWVACSVVAIVLSVTVTHFLSPHAIGSGIPEMKTILNGVSLKGYLSLSTGASKVLGLTLAQMSGLPVGKEGPFVHLASIVATQLMQRISLFRSIYLNDARRLEMLGAACAVGVASNFAAPIGGVLFSIEVTATYFAVRNYWRGFYAAVVSAFVFRTLAVYLFGTRTITALFMTQFKEYPFDVMELVVFMLVGAACGVLGACFVYLHRRVVDAQRWYSDTNHGLVLLRHSRYVYPVLVALICAILTFPGTIGPFMGLTMQAEIKDFFSEKPLACSSNWATQNVFMSLLIFFGLKFMLTVFAATLPVPAGIFVPVFVLGASFGRLCGEAMSLLFPHGVGALWWWGDSGPLPLLGLNDTVLTAAAAMCGDDPSMARAHVVAGGYAVAGAAALAGSVTHTISTSVIVFELTGQLHHIIPVMVAVLISNAVCQRLSPSIYDSIIQIKRMPYLPDLRKGDTYNLTVADLMDRSVPFVSLTSSYARLVHVLENSEETLFPLVNSPSEKILLGAVPRANLEEILRRQLQRPFQQPDRLLPVDFAVEQGGDADVISIIRPSGAALPPVAAVTPSRRTSESSLGSELRAMHSIASEDPSFQPSFANNQAGHAARLRETIDLAGVHVDHSPTQLVERTSLYKVHTLFMLLGITTALVTSAGRFVGVVTSAHVRQAIERAGLRRMERTTPPSPPHPVRKVIFQSE